MSDGEYFFDAIFRLAASVLSDPPECDCVSFSSLFLAVIVFLRQGRSVCWLTSSFDNCFCAVFARVAYGVFFLRRARSLEGRGEGPGLGSGRFGCEQLRPPDDVAFACNYWPLLDCASFG